MILHNNPYAKYNLVPTVSKLEQLPKDNTVYAIVQPYRQDPDQES